MSQVLVFFFYEDSVNARGHYCTLKAWYKIALTRYKTHRLQEPGESILVKVKQFHHVITSIGKAPAECALGGAVPSIVGGGLWGRTAYRIKAVLNKVKLLKWRQSPASMPLAMTLQQQGWQVALPFIFSPPTKWSESSLVLWL